MLFSDILNFNFVQIGLGLNGNKIGLFVCMGFVLAVCVYLSY